MLKIMSMFFTGLTFFSLHAFASTDCLQGFNGPYNYKTEQQQNESSLMEVLSGKPKESFSKKTNSRLISQKFIDDFCSSDLQNRVGELKICFSDAFEAGLGSSAQPKVQQICLAILQKTSNYKNFQNCYDYAKTKFADSYDAFEACLEGN